MDSGFGNCEIVNMCTAEKKNTTAGYILYAGKSHISTKELNRASVKICLIMKTLFELSFYVSMNIF